MLLPSSSSQLIIPCHCLNHALGLQQSDLLIDVAGAALLCKAAGLKPKGDILTKLKSFMTTDGKFRVSTASKETSIEDGKLALRALAAYADDGADAALKDVFSAALSLVPSGEDDHPVDPTVLASLSKLSTSKPKLVGARLVAVAESLLQLRHSGRMEVLAEVLVALDVVMSYKASPVHVSFVNPIVGAEAISKTLVVNVVDIRGNAVSTTTLEAKSVKRVGRDNIMFQGPLDGSSLDLSTLDGFVPGLYATELAVTVASQPKPIVAKLNFAVQGKVEIVQVKAGVTDSKESFASELIDVSSPNSASGISGSAISDQFFHVSFGVTTPSKVGKRFQKPHQVFVRFTHAATGTSSYFVGVAEGSLGDSIVGTKYRVAVALSKETQTFMHLSGAYTLSILVSDVAYAQGIEWVVGTAELTFPAKAAATYPLYTKPLMYESDNTLKPLPEIVHQMRPADKRASSFMATVFTLGVIAPLVVFVGYMLSLGPNLKRLQSLSSFLFVGCMVAVIFLIVGYWLGLEGVSFYDTIRYLCFLVPITMLVGSSAISSITFTRLEEAKKAV